MHVTFRRKPSAVSLCNSIGSAIQWFQIHHGITIPIHNPAVYLSGARVSISLTLVSRLKQLSKTKPPSSEYIIGSVANKQMDVNSNALANI